MRVTLNESCIEVTITKGGISATEDITPVDALRYARALKMLATGLIDEFPNETDDDDD